jgi:hypothetical protein
MQIGTQRGSRISHPCLVQVTGCLGGLFQLAVAILGAVLPAQSPLHSVVERAYTMIDVARICFLVSVEFVFIGLIFWQLRCICRGYHPLMRHRPIYKSERPLLFWFMAVPPLVVSTVFFIAFAVHLFRVVTA